MFCFVLSFKFPCIYYLIHIIDVIADFSSFYSMICFKNAFFYRHGMLSASLNLLEHSSGRIDPCQGGVESPMSLTASNKLTDTSHWFRILVKNIYFFILKLLARGHCRKVLKSFKLDDCREGKNIQYRNVETKQFLSINN